jgi:hypothetical protein
MWLTLVDTPDSVLVGGRFGSLWMHLCQKEFVLRSCTQVHVEAVGPPRRSANIVQGGDEVSARRVGGGFN